jgi:16S rRNA (cytidine1402-2'-O)-methyltransferase
LGDVDLVAAEDTRHSAHLLNYLKIRKPLVSYHAFSEAKKIPKLLEELTAGRSVAIISDAGLPGLSDPGERLIRAVIEAGFPIEIIPGPSAPLIALVGSGMPVVPFYFGGFLPVKSGGRKRELGAAGARSCTSVYFESPYRIERMLTDAQEVIPLNPLCLARELTKKFEQFQRGTASALLAELKLKKPKGEYCLVVGSLNPKKGATLEPEAELEEVEEAESGEEDQGQEV